MYVTIFAFTLFAAAPMGIPPDAPLNIQTTVHLQSASDRASDAGDLAAQSLAAGHGDEALATLQRASAADPDDAALLINLGIAYAQQGEDAKARAAFEAALASDAVIELETADGTATDSRRLARKALKMLSRGAFRADAAQQGQLTYRN